MENAYRPHAGYSIHLHWTYPQGAAKKVSTEVFWQYLHKKTTKYPSQQVISAWLNDCNVTKKQQVTDWMSVTKQKRQLTDWYFFTLAHCFLSSVESSQDLTKRPSELSMWKWQIIGCTFGQHSRTTFAAATTLSVTTTLVVSTLLFSEKKFKNRSTCVRSFELTTANATGRPTPLLSSTSSDSSTYCSRVD